MADDRALAQAALPAYEVGEVVGAGSYGLVRIGRHRSLDRAVAIKILRSQDESSGAELRRRFAIEARILAGLDHPHVVRVFDFVERDDVCLLVMEYLTGGRLADRLSPPNRVEFACAVGLAAAEALHAAHSADVLHRDIKPANILFAADDTVKVADFGIAKQLGGSAASASAVLGTFGFMPPEQIQAGRLGPASDVYALAVVLYRIVTGRMPFDHRLPLAELLRLQTQTVPPAPDGVPGPVTEAILRALAVETVDRTASARAFSIELAEAAHAAFGPSWLSRAGLPLRVADVIRAAATGAHQRMLATHPAPGADVPAGGLVAADLRGAELTGHDLRGADLSGADLGGARLRGVDLTGANLRGTRLRRARLERVTLTSANLSGADLRRARLREVDLTGAETTDTRWDGAVLLGCALPAGDGPAPELTGADVAGRARVRLHVAPRGPASALAVAPDREGAAVVWGDRLTLVDLVERRLTFVLPAPGSVSGPLEISADGRYVAGTVTASPGATTDAVPYLWDTWTGGAPTALPAEAARYWFTARTNLVVWQTADGAIAYWPVERPGQPGTPREYSDVGFVSARSADGETVARTYGRAPIEVVQVSSGRRTLRIGGITHRIAALALSADASLIAAADETGSLVVARTADGEPLFGLTGRPAGAAAFATALAFTADGQALLADNDTIAIPSGDVTPSPSLRLTSLVLSPNGEWWAAIQTDGRLATGNRAGDRRLVDGPEVHGRLAFAADGRTVVALTVGGGLGAWDVHTGAEVWEPRWPWEPRPRAPLGRAAAPGRRVQAPAEPDPARAAANTVFTPDGTALVTAGPDDQVRLWDVATGRQRGRLRYGRPIEVAALSPDGTSIVVAGRGQAPRVWDLASGRELILRLAPADEWNGATALAYSPDSRLLAVGVRDTVRLVYAQSGEQRATLPRLPGTVRGLAFSPDGTRLAEVGDHDGIHFWDVATGHTTTTVPAAPNGQIEYVRGGAWLWTAGGRDGRAELRYRQAAGDAEPTWRSTGLRSRLWPAVSGASPAFADLAADGITIIVAGTGLLRRITVPALTPVAHVAFSPDRSLLAICRADGEVELVNTGSGRVEARLIGLPDGWVTTVDDDRRYSVMGNVDDLVWWTLGRTRFAVGELDSVAEAGVSRLPLDWTMPAVRALVAEDPPTVVPPDPPGFPAMLRRFRR